MSKYQRDENGLILSPQAGPWHERGTGRRSSQYLGVTYQASCGRRPWRVMVWNTAIRRNVSLGGYATEIAAARAATRYKDHGAGQAPVLAVDSDMEAEMKITAGMGRADREGGLREIRELGLEFRGHWICRGCGAEADPTFGPCRKCGSCGFERCALSRKGR